MNKATQFTLDWIFYNNHDQRFKKAISVDDLKLMVIRQLGGYVSDSFIKGAKLVKWESVFRAIGCYQWLFIASAMYALMYAPFSIINYNKNR